MSKKKKGPDFSSMKIILIAGAIGAGLAAAVLSFLAFIPMSKKKNQEPDQEPDQEPEQAT
jgi:flagellar basal body-associated protein FliL